MIAYAQFMFPPAGPPLGGGDNAINYNPTIQTQDEFDVRVDQKIGANDSAFFRYSFINNLIRSSTGLPIISTNKTTPARSWGFNYVHVFGPSLDLAGAIFANDASVQSNRVSLRCQSRTSLMRWVLRRLIAATSPRRMDRIFCLHQESQDIRALGKCHETIPKTTDAYQESATLTKTIGNHALTFGGGYTSLGQHVNDSFSTLAFLGEQTADTNPVDTINTGDPIAILHYQRSQHRLPQRYGGR